MNLFIYSVIIHPSSKSSLLVVREEDRFYASNTSGKNQRIGRQFPEEKLRTSLYVRERPHAEADRVVRLEHLQPANATRACAERGEHYLRFIHSLTQKKVFSPLLPHSHLVPALPVPHASTQIVAHHRASEEEVHRQKRSVRLKTREMSERARETRRTLSLSLSQLTFTRDPL